MTPKLPGLLTWLAMGHAGRRQWMLMLLAERALRLSAAANNQS